MSNRKVSIEQCLQIREYRESGKSIREIQDLMDQRFSDRTIRRHSNAYCKCGEEKGSINEQQCVEIRQADVNHHELADEYGVGTETIRNHCYGRCSHPGEGNDPGNYKNYRQSGISPELCAEWRNRVRSDRTRVNLVEESDHGYSTIRYHTVGRCNHDIDVEPVILTITQDTCNEIRREARNYNTVMDYSKTLPWEYSVVNSHARGHCNHVDEVEPMPEFARLKVTKEECDEIQRLYYEEHLWAEKIAEQMDLDIKVEQIKRHASGICKEHRV